MLNTATLSGRLCADPELRYTANKKAVVSFRVAVKRDIGEGTDFINCSAWGKTAEFVDQWFHRGTMILLMGHIQSRDYAGKDGKKRNAVEVVAEHVWFGEAKKKERDGVQNEGAFRDPFVEEYGEPDEFPL